MIDFITPPRCLSCRAPVDEAASLCAGCWPLLAHIDDPVCDALGTPLAVDAGIPMLSAAAMADPPPWDRMRAAVAFDETARVLVHALKYHDTQEAGLLMARMMARAGRSLLADAQIIVPVPLHRLRLWQRRFNQSGFLCQRLSVATGRPWRADVLERVKPTRPQVGLDRVERRRNLRNAFQVRPAGLSEIAGRRVLLVDDVLTTGATAGACTQALRQAGAAQVDVLTFALVVAPAQLHI